MLSCLWKFKIQISHRPISQMDNIDLTIPEQILSPIISDVVYDDDATIIDGKLSPICDTKNSVPLEFSKSKGKRKTGPIKKKPAKSTKKKKTSTSLSKSPPELPKLEREVPGEKEIQAILGSPTSSTLSIKKMLDPKRQIFRYRTGFNLDEDVTAGWLKSSDHLDKFEFARAINSTYCTYYNLWKPVLIEFPDFVKTFGYRDPSRANKFGDAQNKIDLRLGSDWVETEEIKAMYEVACRDFERHLRCNRMNPGKIKFAPLIKDPKGPPSSEILLKYNAILSAMVTNKTRMFNDEDLTKKVQFIKFGHRVRALLVFGGVKYVQSTKKFHPIINLSLAYVHPNDVRSEKMNRQEKEDFFTKKICEMQVKVEQ